MINIINAAMWDNSTFCALKIFFRVNTPYLSKSKYYFMFLYLSKYKLYYNNKIPDINSWRWCPTIFLTRVGPCSSVTIFIALFCHGNDIMHREQKQLPQSTHFTIPKL